MDSLCRTRCVERGRKEPARWICVSLRPEPENAVRNVCLWSQDCREFRVQGRGKPPTPSPVSATPHPSGNATQCRSYPVRDDSDAISPLGKWSLAATLLVWYPGYERHRHSPQQRTYRWYSERAQRDGGQRATLTRFSRCDRSGSAAVGRTGTAWRGDAHPRCRVRRPTCSGVSRAGLPAGPNRVGSGTARASRPDRCGRGPRCTADTRRPRWLRCWARP